jgi:guanosine-3',5'-bis(diphosphate) 3'-pyrophosphohydrolase
MTDHELDKLFVTLEFAMYKHRNQRRKDRENIPYINHPIEVMTILWKRGAVRDLATLLGALLHDTLEDTETTEAELDSHFGAEVAHIVREVSDNKSLPKMLRKQQQIDHAGNLSRAACEIKIADKIANVQEILDNPPQGWSRRRRWEYIQWATEVVENLAHQNPFLTDYFHGLVHRGKAQLS